MTCCLLNPGDESCGALIRADAYGYACPGNPDLAAWLAWKDASFTHIRTGVYGADVHRRPGWPCATRPRPGEPGAGTIAWSWSSRRCESHARQQSVLAEGGLDDSLVAGVAAAATDWQSGLPKRIHGRYREYSHCQVFQEIGTLINTLRFAASVGPRYLPAGQPGQRHR